MASIRKNVLFAGIALLALGATVVAITTDRSTRDSERLRPVEVSPESEAATPAELDRRLQAIPQPSGTLRSGQAPIAPVIANPQR